jgi:hypothetical protein
MTFRKIAIKTTAKTAKLTLSIKRTVNLSEGGPFLLGNAILAPGFIIAGLAGCVYKANIQTGLLHLLSNP